MLVVRSLIAVALLTVRIPVVRVSLFVCLGALIESAVTVFIMSLPMGNLARKVFVVLSYVALFAFCIDVVVRVLDDHFDLTLNDLIKRVGRDK